LGLEWNSLLKKCVDIMYEKVDLTMEKKKLFDRLLSQAGDILCVNITRDEKLLGICGLLRENVAYYNWVGFYLVERERGNLCWDHLWVRQQDIPG